MNDPAALKKQDLAAVAGRLADKIVAAYLNNTVQFPLDCGFLFEIEDYRKKKREIND